MILKKLNSIKIPVYLSGLLLLFVCAYTQDNLRINGKNYAEYRYKADNDSLANYFKDYLTFRLSYKQISLAASFEADLPYYSPYEQAEQINEKDIKFTWKKILFSYTNQSVGVRVGEFESIFSEGVIFRSYEDKDIEHNTLLNGAEVSLNFRNLELKTVYGALPSVVTGKEEKNEIAYGADALLKIKEWLRTGFTFLGFHELHILNDEYTENTIISGRVDAKDELSSFYLEGAYLEQENAEFKALEGHAVYSEIEREISEKLKVSLAYKNYENFHYRLNDLPMINHSEKNISMNRPGYDEQGIGGEADYTLKNDTNILLNYFEGWSSNYQQRQSDLYVQLQKEIGSCLVSLQYSHYERLMKDTRQYEREENPVIILDFTEKNFLIKSGMKFEKNNDQNVIKRIFYPYLQTDLVIFKVNTSLIGEAEQKEGNDLNKLKFYPAMELKSKINTSTELTFFLGKERGGKVCRNGSCRYQNPFEGIKVNLTTFF